MQAGTRRGAQNGFTAKIRTLDVRKVEGGQPTWRENRVVKVPGLE